MMAFAGKRQMVQAPPVGRAARLRAQHQRNKRAVLAALKSGEAGASTLAERTGIDRYAVMRALKSLERDALITAGGARCAWKLTTRETVDG